MVCLLVYLVFSLCLGCLWGGGLMGCVLMGFLLFSFYSSSCADVIWVGGGLYLDGFTGLLTFLSALICMVIYMGNVYKFGPMVYWKILLCVLLVVSFKINNFLGFFMFFELCMVPMSLMVVGHGFQPERLTATKYMVVYTVVGSIPFLLCLFFLEDLTGSYKYLLYFYGKGMSDYVFIVGGGLGWWVMGMLLAFAMKLPLYGFHLWLPKAHVEAPVEGSVMLASVLLKLGSYGIYRVSSGCWLSIGWGWDVIWGFYLLSMLFCGTMCFLLGDFKVFMAYSSVVHMLVLFVCCLSGSFSGYSGVLLLSVSHGFCSAGLFYGFKLFYGDSMSRNIKYNSGSMWGGGLLLFFWFFMCFMNCSLPPSLNLISEIYCFISIYMVSGVSVVVVCLSVFMGGLFCFFLFGLIYWGSWMKPSLMGSGMSYVSSLVMFVYLVWSFILILFLGLLV